MHIALCCDKLLPLIAPLQPVNSTVCVLLLEELEMAKQVWAGQGYIYLNGGGMEMGTLLYIWVYSTRLMCVYLLKSAMPC